MNSIAIKPAATAHIYLAQLFYEINDLESAEQHAALSTQIEPDLGDAFYTLGVIHYNKGRVDEATAALERAIALDPDHEWASHLLREIHDDNGRVT